MGRSCLICCLNPAESEKSFHWFIVPPLRDNQSKLLALLSLHDDLRVPSSISVFAPPDILVPVRLLNPLQVCWPGSSTLTPARASTENCERLDVLTRMQAGPILRLLNWFSSWSESGPRIVVAIFLDDSWTAGIWCSVLLHHLLRSQLLCDAGQHSSSFVLEPCVAVPLLPGSHPVTWM